MKIEIGTDDLNKRIDVFLSEQKIELSRTAIQRLLEEKKILVNGKEKRASYRLSNGDEITVEIPKATDIQIEAEDISVPVIYEDKDIIVVNKPKGMVVHPGNGNQDGTLVNALLSMCKGSLSGIGGKVRPGIVHRLDKDTSGLLIVAKNDKAHINMSKQIQDRKVVKKYIALVKGVVSENEATIDMPIARSKEDRKKMAIDKNGKKAVTHFKVLERFDKYTLLELKIDTGRTHQIRVHMAEIGHPVIGDMVYSKGKNEFGIEGQMLHAKMLEFNHPTTGEKMHLEADIPNYFKEVIEKLEKEKSE